MFVGILDQCTGYISLVLNTYALIIVFYEISLKYFFSRICSIQFNFMCNKRISFVRSSSNDKYPIGHIQIWSYTGRLHH